MIPRTAHTAYTPSWQEELKNSITCPKTLYSALQLEPESLPQAWQAHESFKVRVTPSYLSRIEQGNPNDPLLKQILPSAEELLEHPAFVSDPLQESQHNPVKGLIHKYHGRVLLITEGQCAINCRYCFRREFDYQANRPNRQEWQHALDYIGANPSINEVILSGGDPLVVNDKQLEWLIRHISAIPHISRLRIHTRLPVVLPSRITTALTNLLSQTHLKVVVVIHSNHAKEFDTHTADALAQLKHANTTLLNQSVLLAGINDCVKTLAELSEKLFAQDVLPYYLHIVDKVKGASHFDVPISKAITIHKSLQTQLPGFLVPKLVQEVPGKPNKTLIF